MRHLIRAAVAISVFAVIGCSRSDPGLTKAPPGRPNGAPAPTVTPEIAIAKMETPEERKTYLDQLARDTGFEPQKHSEMLQKYAADSNLEVAAKAKELLDRSPN